MKSKIRIYTAGGCGLKAAYNLVNVPNKPGYTRPVIAVFDSSKSDLQTDTSNHEISPVFLDEDGLGKNRKLAASVIRPHIAPFVANHAPGQVNIVIFSLSGGTGSVAGPMIVKELMAQGENVVALVVGDTSNKTEAENTLSTLSDLSKLSKESGKALNIMYYENKDDVGEKETHHINVNTIPNVDRALERDISALCLLFSGEHIGLDSKDITNFLNFNNTTKIDAKMVELCFTPNFEELDAYVGSVYAMATICSSPDVEIPKLGQPYGVRAYYNQKCIDTAGESIRNVAFVSTPVTIPAVIENLKAEIINLREKAAEMNTMSNGLDDLDDFADDVGI